MSKVIPHIKPKSIYFYRTTQCIPQMTSPSQDSPAKTKFKEVTTPTSRPTVRCTTYAQGTRMAECEVTNFCVATVPFSISAIWCAKTTGAYVAEIRESITGMLPPFWKNLKLDWREKGETEKLQRRLLTFILSVFKLQYC